MIIRTRGGNITDDTNSDSINISRENEQISIKKMYRKRVLPKLL